MMIFFGHTGAGHTYIAIEHSQPGARLLLRREKRLDFDYRGFVWLPTSGSAKIDIKLNTKKSGASKS